MGRIAKVTAGSPLAIKATEWNAIADAVNVSVEQRVRGGSIQQAISVLIRNDTGEDLDRYDTLALGEPIFTLEEDGSVDLIFAGVKADPLKPPAIMLEPVANATPKRFGRAWIHGLAYAFVAPGSPTATQANPTASGNILTPGSGPVRLLGAPSATETLLLPVLLGAGGGGDALIAVTPAGGIAARTDNTFPLTFPSATCYRVNPDTGAYVDPPEEVVVFNMTSIAISAQSLIQAKRIGSRWFVDVDNCGATALNLPETAEPPPPA